MYKYILNKINKYHQEITVDDKFWTYLKDDLEEVLKKLSSKSIWLREENSWEDLIRELGAEGVWGGDSFEALEDYLDYDKLANALMSDGFVECDFGFLEIAL